MAEKWRSIKTAPKDGTMILAYGSIEGYPFGKLVKWGNRPCVAWFDGIWQGGQGCMGIKPTLWMPIYLPKKKRI